MQFRMLVNCCFKHFSLFFFFFLFNSTPFILNLKTCEEFVISLCCIFLCNIHITRFRTVPTTTGAM